MWLAIRAGVYSCWIPPPSLLPMRRNCSIVCVDRRRRTSTHPRRDESVLETRHGGTKRKGHRLEKAGGLDGRSFRCVSGVFGVSGLRYALALLPAGHCEDGRGAHELAWLLHFSAAASARARHARTVQTVVSREGATRNSPHPPLLVPLSPSA